MNKILSFAIILTLLLFPVHPAHGDSEYLESWQSAYLKILAEKRIEQGDKTDGMESLSSYALYDIDKDGIPELFLRFGISTASSKCILYTYNKDAAIYIDEFYFGSSSLYSYPGENGVLMIYSHMYHAKGSLLTVSDNHLNSILIYEEVVDPQAGQWYTPVNDYCLGATIISEFRCDQDYPLLSYYTWSQPVSPVLNAQYPNNDAHFFENVLNENKQVVRVRIPSVGIFLDGDDIENVGCSSLLNSLLQPTKTESGNLDNGEFKAFVSDLNHDGSLEYLLCHRTVIGQLYFNQFMIILSEQKGVLYAYVDELHTFTNVDSTGVFYLYSEEFGRIGESAFRFFFDTENCMKLSCSLDDYTGIRGK